jgi:Ras family
MECRRVVSTDEGEEMAKKHDMLFVETSAKTASNIEQVFEFLDKGVLKRC